MGALSFLNPAFLLALALAAIPILLHLMRRRRVQVVPWAAWDFLLNSLQRNRKRLRIEQLLLLLVRVAIVVLVVFAFARPLLVGAASRLIGRNSSTYAIVVLDCSLSMAANAANGTALERAKRAAETIVDQVLRPGDSFSLVLATARPEAAIRSPSYDLAALRARIRQARVSDRGTDYGATARMVAALLRESRSASAEVYWITDSQASGFKESDQKPTQQAFAALAERCRVLWIDVGGGAPANAAVEAPSFSRELVTPGHPVRIVARVHHYGREPIPSARVTLEVDGRNAGTAEVRLPAKGTAPVSFVYPFASPGLHAGRVSVDSDDALPRDNDAWFALWVRERLNVLLVNPRPSSDPARDEAFYLALALSPASASEGGQSAVRVTQRSSLADSALDLSAFDVIVCVGASVVDQATVGTLRNYVRAGGGLFLLPGAATDGLAVSSAYDKQGPFLPARFGARRSVELEQAPSLDPASLQGAALAPFKDPAVADVGSGRFTVSFDLAAGEQAAADPDIGAARIIGRFSDGRPALVERTFGRGRILMSAWPAGANGSTLPYKPVYVPLVHQLVAFLGAGASASRILTVDQTYVARFPVRASGQTFRLVRPDGSTQNLPVVMSGDGLSVQAADTALAGIYRIAAGARENADGFAANLDPAEFDLTRLDAAALTAMTGGARVTYVREGADIVSSARRARYGAELWRLAVLLALPLLFLEALMAQRFGRRA